MPERRLLSVADFVKFARITRDTIYHYDRIGLLLPILRDENNYRYYSSGQLAVVNVIRTLQELGLTLNEIKALVDQRTPTKTNDMLLNQMGKIDQKIDEWIHARKLLSSLQKVIYPVMNIDEDVIAIRSLSAEPIILGDMNDYSEGNGDYAALLSFYNTVNDKYLDLGLNYPVWGMFSEERIKKGDWFFPDRYYFYSSRGRNERPAALYAVGYTRCGYGQGAALYGRLITYINQNGFEICGDAYEEYPLNEVCISDDTNYLMRVMITVRKKQE